MPCCRLRKRCSLGRWIFICVIVLFLHQTFIAKNHFTAVPYRMAMDAGAIFDVRTDSKVLQGLIQRHANDEELVEFVRSHLIKPPSGMEYNLTHPQFDHPSRDQSTKIDHYLQGQRNGTFIDVGAADGEFDSITLFFERNRNWKGLLIEPDKGRYHRMEQKHRKAALLNARVKMANTKNNSLKVSPSKNFEDGMIPSLWIETILQAYGKQTIDLINIDAHTNEIAILKSIPLEKFYIRVIVLELSSDLLEELSSLYSEMIRKGYYALHQFTNKRIGKLDVIFVNKKNDLPLKVT